VIRYTFLFSPESRLEFRVNEDADTSVETGEAPVPDWLALEPFRCPDCTLPPGSRRTCPAALAMKPVVELFREHASFEKVSLIVELHGVRLEGEAPLQIAVRSLLGLVLGCSDCPVLALYRPLAHLHLPFGDREHTTFRVVGMYLIAQALRQRAGLPADWELEHLPDLVAKVHRVNRKLSERLRLVHGGDASINSLISLDTLAALVELSLDGGAEKVAPLFRAYLNP